MDTQQRIPKSLTTTLTTDHPRASIAAPDFRRTATSICWSPLWMFLALFLIFPWAAIAQVDDCDSSWCRGETWPRHMRPDVAWAPSAQVGLAVWEDTQTSEVWYRAFSSTGSLYRSSATRLATNAGRPRVTADTYGFLVVYEDYSAGPDTRRIKSQKLRSSDVTCPRFCLLLPPPQTLSSPGELEESRPNVTWDPVVNGFATSWTSFRHLSGGTPNPAGHDLFRLVQPSAGFCWPPPCSNGLVPTNSEAFHKSGRNSILGSVDDNYLWTLHSEAAAGVPYWELFTIRRSAFPLNGQGLGHAVNYGITMAYNYYDQAPGYPYPAKEMAAFVEPQISEGSRNSTSVDYLVVWEEATPGAGAWEDDPSVYGACVRISRTNGGTQITSGPFPIAYHHSKAKTRPDVEFIEAENRYLVAWSDEEYNFSPPYFTYDNDIRGRYVTCSGESHSTSAIFNVSNYQPWSGLPRIATDGTQAFVVFEQILPSERRIILHRIVGGSLMGGGVFLD